MKSIQIKRNLYQVTSAIGNFKVLATDFADAEELAREYLSNQNSPYAIINGIQYLEEVICKGIATKIDM